MRANDLAGNTGLAVGTYCLPHHRMPFKSRTEGSKRGSMTWRVISARPYAMDFSYDQCIRVIAMPKPNTLAFGVGAKPGGRGSIQNKHSTDVESTYRVRVFG